MSAFNYSTTKREWPDFGDYVEIEQKRFGVPNEMFVHKVIGRLRSNSWIDIPAVVHLGATLHETVEDVVNVICCDISEDKVLRYRVADLKPYHIAVGATAEASEDARDAATSICQDTRFMDALDGYMDAVTTDERNTDRRVKCRLEIFAAADAWRDAAISAMAPQDSAKMDVL